MKTIKIKNKNNYGNIVYYSACTDSELFSEIADTRTLTQESLRKIKVLGYTIQIISEELPEFAQA